MGVIIPSACATDHSAVPVEHSISNLDVLPEELQVSIMSFLGQRDLASIMVTDRKRKRIAKTIDLWKDLTVPKIYNPDLGEILKRCSKVETLHLDVTGMNTGELDTLHEALLGLSGLKTLCLKDNITHGNGYSADYAKRYTMPEVYPLLYTHLLKFVIDMQYSETLRSLFLPNGQDAFALTTLMLNPEFLGNEYTSYLHSDDVANIISESYMMSVLEKLHRYKSLTLMNIGGLRQLYETYDSNVILCDILNNPW